MAGIHGRGVPFVFTDGAWARFPLAERYGVTDPETGGPARRNPFLRRRDAFPLHQDASVEALRERGVVFALCNTSLEGAVAAFVQEGHGDEESVRKMLLGLLVPGVHVVPAMVATLNKLQQRGFSYVYTG